MRYSFIAMRTVLIYSTKNDAQLAVSLFCAVGVAATTMGLPTILNAHTHTNHVGVYVGRGQHLLAKMTPDGAIKSYLTGK